MPTLRTTLALTVALATALTAPLAQQPAAKWSPDLLAEAAERTVGAEPVALPQPGGELPTRYEVRLVASRTKGTGSLAVTVRDAAGQTLRLFAEGTTSQTKVTLHWIVDDGRIEAGTGTTLTKASNPERDQAGEQAGDPASDASATPWTVRASGAEFRLDGLRWRDAPASQKKATVAEQPQRNPAKAKPDLMQRLAQRQRWTGTIDSDRGKPQDCTLVILEQSATKLVFRLDNERGGRFRFECTIENGKPKVTRVVHTKNASGGALAVIGDEKGQGRLVGDRFELDYSFVCRISGRKNTATGRITIDLPPLR
ncbi:MAG: hypothetical protein JNN13_05760 [Planctomycetes bacterium]|nr:hypothetical protein [Planctomycetota bacterium]